MEKNPNIEVIDDELYIDKGEKDYRLGGGGFASVFKCHSRKNPQKLFAAKKVVLAKNDFTMDYLKKEISTLTRIKDVKNVTVLYKSVTKEPDDKGNTITYLIMELCNGGTLETLTEKYGPLTEKAIYYIMFPLVECLADLHKRKIIHRDIKLENVLLVDNWRNDSPESVEVRLADFGVSSSKALNTFTILGTKVFMAPEIFLEQEYTAAVDVYAFGVVLYKMLFKTLPFDDKACQVWFKSSIPLIRIPKCRLLSVECFDLLQRCLRVQPEERITFAEMKTHPFFVKKGTDIRIFDEMFDGSNDILYFNLRGPLIDYVKLVEKQKKEEEKDPIYANNKKVIESIIEKRLL